MRVSCNLSLKSENILASEAPGIILDGLKEAGINLVASLPDINLAELLAVIEGTKGSRMSQSAASRKGGGFIRCSDVVRP